MIDKSLSQYQQDKKKVKKVKKIKGQKHMLAYITPNEANKLVALGGKKVMTKEGVPAFPEWDNYGMSSSEFSGSSSSNGGSSNSDDNRESYISKQYTPAPAPAPTTQDIKEEEWATGSYTSPTTTTETSDGDSTTPKGRNWLGDVDPNNTTGWKEKDLHMDSDGDITRTTDDTDDDENALSYVIPKTQPKVLGVDKFGNPIVQRTTPYTLPDTDTDTTPWYKPTTKKLVDTGKSQAKKMVRNKIMKELGLAGLNPLLGIGSFLLGKFAPDKKAALQSKIDAATKNLTKPREINPLDEFGYKGNVYAKKPTEQRPEGDKDDLAKVVAGKGDVVSKAVNQFAGTKVETQLAALVKNDLNRALHYYAKMTPNIEAGKASQQEMDAYDLLGKYLVQAAPTKQDNRNYI
jgi:hypothetical protein